MSIQEIREFITAHARNLAEILRGDRLRAQEAIRTHFEPLVLIPEVQDSIPMYRIDRGLRLRPVQKGNM